MQEDAGSASRVERGRGGVRTRRREGRGKRAMEALRVPLLLLAASLLTCPPQLVHGAECKEGCDLRQGYCEVDGECRCQPGWQGELCGNCTRFPGCQRGSCHMPWQCDCEDGWTGRLCDRDLNFCEHNRPCHNNGSCSDDGSGGFACACADGFTGSRCEERAGPCHQQGYPCKNGGACMDEAGSAHVLVCLCPRGFSGPLCEVPPDPCVNRQQRGPPSPCAEGSTCVPRGPLHFLCVCPPGRAGRRCELAAASSSSLSSSSTAVHPSAFAAGAAASLIGSTVPGPAMPPERSFAEPTDAGEDLTKTGEGNSEAAQARPQPNLQLKITVVETEQRREGGDGLLLSDSGWLSALLAVLAFVGLVLACTLAALLHREGLWSAVARHGPRRGVEESGGLDDVEATAGSHSNLIGPGRLKPPSVKAVDNITTLLEPGQLNKAHKDTNLRQSLACAKSLQG
ncbi:uncharacterized protein LOC144723690 [Lampetra planeri]